MYVGSQLQRLCLLLLLSLPHSFGRVRFPIGLPVDAHLPVLGTSNSGLPQWVQRRGFYDPLAQILCWGRVPDDYVPRKYLPDSAIHNWFQNPPHFTDIYPTLRSLCAKIAYGGVTTAWTAGGYCASSANPPTVVFEQLPPGVREWHDDTKRIFLLCQHSCRCVETADSRELRSQGRPAEAIVESETVSQFALSSYPDSYGISKPHPPRAPLYGTDPPLMSGQRPKIPIFFIPEVDARSIDAQTRLSETHRTTTLWLPALPKLFAPVCNGAMSTPGELNLSPQQVCTAEWFGGTKAGNVGLACEETGMILDGGAGLVKEDYVAHPALRAFGPHGGPRNRYDEIKDDCNRLCKCKLPEPESAPVVEPPVLVEGLFEAARDFVNGVCRMGQIVSSNASSCARFQVSTYSSTGTGTGTKYGSLNKDLRLASMCKSQTVNGFDLASSIATQSLCKYGLGG